MKLHKLDNGINILENNTNSFEIIFKNFGYKLDNLFKINGLSHFIEHYLLSIIKFPFAINGITSINNMTIEFYIDENYTLEKIIKYIYNIYIKNNEFNIIKNKKLLDIIKHDLIEEIYFNQSFNKLSLVEMSLLYNNVIYGGGVKYNYLNSNFFFNLLDTIFKKTNPTDIILSVPNINNYILNIIDNTFGNLVKKNKTLIFNNFNLPKKKNKDRILYYSLGYNTSILFTLNNNHDNITDLLIFKYFYFNNILSINLNTLVVNIYFCNENHLKEFLYKIIYGDNIIDTYDTCDIEKYPYFISDLKEYSNILNVYTYLINLKKEDIEIKFNSFLNKLKNIILQKNFIIFTEKNNFLYNTKDDNNYRYYKSEIDIDIINFNKNICNINNDVNNIINDNIVSLFYNKKNNIIKLNLNSLNDICYYINQSHRYNIGNISFDKSSVIKNYFKCNPSCFIYLQLFYFYFFYNVYNIKKLYHKLLHDEYFSITTNDSNIEYVYNSNYNLKILKEKKYFISTEYNFICGTFLMDNKLNIKKILSPAIIKKKKIGYSIILNEKKNKNKKQIYFFLCCININNGYKNIKSILNKNNIKNIIFIISKENPYINFSNLENTITVSF